MKRQTDRENPHFLQLEGAATMNTLGFAATQEAFEDAVAAQAIALVHGEAGLGKTFATRHAIAGAALPVAALAFQTRMTLKRMTQEILLRVTGVPHIGSRFALLDTLHEVLAEQPRILVLDEAQLLSHEAIETLRSLWDAPESQLTLILVGGNGCWEHIERYPMLRSRIYTRVAFGPMTDDDVLETIPHYHPIYAKTATTTIELINARFARGNFREWAAFTRMAQGICQRDRKRHVTADVADEALDRIGRVARAA